MPEHHRVIVQVILRDGKPGPPAARDVRAEVRCFNLARVAFGAVKRSVNFLSLRRRSRTRDWIWHARELVRHRDLPADLHLRPKHQPAKAREERDQQTEENEWRIVHASTPPFVVQALACLLRAWSLEPGTFI